ncbi:alpha/beta hydrolase fold domain-containing protein [Trichoderma breve]|uniref:Alpha/beta hydrolase fold domain-containing protein n=1 Tax=Trichoderma breve TaxID=2034170 RepID=A0A9W9EAX2_9HYPO|nr:alpha/beta hydrolase fold domain-containing protein [Trichoderma breve]KAJ4863336.1 alpha/beta hydrolase fold domain-containing protein [Trichoderma breve]
MTAGTTIRVPHLGGIDAGYRLSNGAVDPAKPTVVLINSMCMTSALYDIQFGNKALTDVANLLAIEPLGHGATETSAENYTYWDTAIMAVQVLDALNIKKAFALGTSQGGWIVTRMALVAPEKIQGLLLLGTSLDYESAASREKGCWDPATMLGPVVDSLYSTEPTPDFLIDAGLRESVVTLGFSGTVTEEKAQFWRDTLDSIYTGDKGRKKLRGAFTNLLERDGLLRRVRDIKCPVYWIQGNQDLVYGVDVPKDHIKAFSGSVETDLSFTDGGHYLNATSPQDVDAKLLQLINKYSAL